MDIGLSEREFWRMTLAELMHYFQSRKRQIERDRKERATFDYIQARIIGAVFAATQDRRNKVPTLEEAYAELFDTPEERQRRADREAELFAARFIQFAQAHNERLANRKGD